MSPCRFFSRMNSCILFTSLEVISFRYFTSIGRVFPGVFATRSISCCALSLQKNVSYFSGNFVVNGCFCQLPRILMVLYEAFLPEHCIGYSRICDVCFSPCPELFCLAFGVVVA